MITVEQALSLVLERARPRPPERARVLESVGLVLAEDVASDIDSPPHDKTMVDGYAVIAADLQDAVTDLRLLEEVAAGAVPARTVTPGTTTRIFTGAPVPPGADAVVMIEQSSTIDQPGGSPVIRLATGPVRRGQNIMPRGQSMRQGETVLRAGHVLRGIEASLLAEVGRSAAWVFPRPRVAILSTGNELVPADAVPAAGQIRNSNGPLLLSLARDAGGMPVDLGIAVDTEADLRRCVAYGLRHEVLILSGGVSAGALDLVPHVLAQEGVQKIFHKVKLKPGKPLWFGTYPCGDERETLVFGLPGNPVSSLVCFELFVRPALHQILRQPPPLTPLRRAVLRDSFQHHGDRPTYYPARLNLAPPSSAATSDLPTVELLNWRGSADLRTLADAHCLVCFPAGEAAYSPGSQVAIQGLMRMN